MNADGFLLMEGIHKRFGGTHALKDVTMSAERGEVHALVGENGAGKSTLMNILSGALRPGSGSDLHRLHGGGNDRARTRRPSSACARCTRISASFPT